MSEITEQCRAFAAGQITEDQLVELLGERTYPEPKGTFQGGIDEFWQRVNGDDALNVDGEGTFLEVDECFDIGILPEPVYDRIHARLMAYLGIEDTGR